MKRIQIDFDIIQIELEVDADLRITESTLARISSDGILPPYFVELQGSLRDSPELPEGAVIRTDPSAMTTASGIGSLARSMTRWTPLVRRSDTFDAGNLSAQPPVALMTVFVRTSKRRSETRSWIAHFQTSPSRVEDSREA